MLNFLRNLFWIKIEDVETANSAIKKGYIAAVIAFLLVGLPVTHASNYINIVNTIFYALVGYFIYKKSRIASIIGTFVYASAVIFGVIFRHQFPTAIAVGIVTLLFFINSVRGTFAFHNIHKINSQ